MQTVYAGPAQAATAPLSFGSPQGCGGHLWLLVWRLQHMSAHLPYSKTRGGLVACRRVAEVDPSLAADVDRELARMRQKDAAAERRQKKQWKGAFSR